MPIALRRLVNTVQRNCNISDAQFAGDYTMCVYLLKMREFYRWKKGIPLGQHINSKAVGSWVAEREAEWERLRDSDYAAITLQGTGHQPMDSDAINQQLLPQGYVYSAGIGRFSKPYFFFADLLNQEALRGYRVIVAGREHARELVAPPAMTQGKHIFIRRECLRRMLWEKVEEWCWRKRENAMARAIEPYGFDGDLEAALDRMTENELEAVILHEIGEVVAGELIGDGWNDMLIAVTRTKAELLVRAVRDLLADCLSSLPALIEEENDSSLHFYFANFNPLQSELFPSLQGSYGRWLESSDVTPMKSVVRDGKSHWLAVAGQILEAFNRYREHSAAPIETLIHDSHF